MRARRAGALLARLRGLPGTRNLADGGLSVTTLPGYVRAVKGLYRGICGEGRTLSELPLALSRRVFGDVAIVSTPYAREFAVDLTDTIVSFAILMTGLWEREEVSVVERLAPRGGSFLDVGAHIGYYSSLFRKIAGPQGSVLAMEPDPRNAAFSRLNAWLDRESKANFRLVEAAAGERPGALAMTRASVGNRGGLQVRPGASAAGARTIDVTTIDDVVAGRALDVMKLDIEGYECVALRGAKETLARNPRLVIVAEYNPRAVRAHGLEPAELFAFAADHRMDVLRIVSGRLVAVNDRDAAALAAGDVEANLVLGRDLTSSLDGLISWRPS